MTQKPNNPVVQQVRDAAAQAYRKIIPNEGGAFTFSESIEVGHEDDHWLVQAFAAHRQATLEEAAKVALRFETADWASYDPRTIATAIRALSAKDLGLKPDPSKVPPTRREPLDIVFGKSCTCGEVCGEDPDCAVHGRHTEWGRENAGIDGSAAIRNLGRTDR